MKQKGSAEVPKTAVPRTATWGCVQKWVSTKNMKIIYAFPLDASHEI